MRKHILGRTGLEITELGYGGGQLRGDRIWSGRAITEEQTDRILNAVLDAGINFIDTANCYGHSEAHIGRFISSRRKEYYLATKCGCQVTDMGDYDEVQHVWTRDKLLRNIDESLSRLKTDYVDLLQFHSPKFEDIVQNDLLEVLAEIRDSGRTRFIGVSAILPHLPRFLELGGFDTVQIPYSALEREHEELIGRAAAAGYGTIIRGGVAKGAPAKEAGSEWERWQRANLDELLDGMSRMAFMLRFTLSHPHLHTTIVATISPQHLADNLAVAQQGPLPPDVYQEAKRRLQ